jgi:hypothetical protein
MSVTNIGYVKRSEIYSIGDFEISADSITLSIDQAKARSLVRSRLTDIAQSQEHLDV